MTKDELVRRLREIEVISKEPVVLRSGATAEFYCDIKKAYGYPDILNAFADVIAAQLPESTTCIAGSGHGGLPLAAVIASRFDKKLVAVRSIAKDHGKKKPVDGYQPTPADVIVIVDDVLTSGSSIRETFSLLEAGGASVASAVVLVKRGEAQLPIPCAYVFSVEELDRKSVV